MNAILVFDPANDLLFVKSNKLFRATLGQYAQSSHLLLQEGKESLSSSASSEATTTEEEERPNDVSSAENEMTSQRSELQRRPAEKKKKKKRLLASCSPNRKQKEMDDDDDDEQEVRTSSNKWRAADTSKSYLEVLMLLLTPYVASLRLASSLELEAAHERKKWSSSQRVGRQQVAHGTSQAEEVESTTSLLGKFISSISVGQECEQQQTSSESAQFSSLKMPVECLQHCQVAYCQLAEFIFLHLQQFQQVSSFKMRLMQKRVEMFARLSLFLFGTSLNELRTSCCDDDDEQNNNQQQVLRDLYDCWLEHQFEPDYLLEAEEKLLLGKQVELQCQASLRKLSSHLRQAEACSERTPLVYRANESHQHALLFARNKLAAKFSCLNGSKLASDDLQLVALLLRAFKEQSDKKKGPENGRAGWFYESHYSADRHTCKIISSNNFKRGEQQQQEDEKKRATCLLKRVCLFLSTSSHLTSSSGKQPPAHGPHLASFLELGEQVFLVLLSEVTGSSHLSLNLSRAQALLLELAGQRARTSSQIDHDPANNQLTLNQLRKANYCIQSIRDYFFGPNARHFLAAAAGQQERVSNNSTTSVFASLNLEQKRLCRHLLRRLQEFASNNVQTYMRQTFSLPVDEHKREALLGRVCELVRDSFGEFVLKPQLALLASEDEEYSNFVACLHDQIKLAARDELSDYLEFLTAKAACNVPLGAPLTHDMPAISAFIYIDRARQQLVSVPGELEPERMSRQELAEADFGARLERASCAESSSSDEEESGNRWHRKRGHLLLERPPSGSQDLTSGAPTTTGASSSSSCSDSASSSREPLKTASFCWSASEQELCCSDLERGGRKRLQWPLETSPTTIGQHQNDADSHPKQVDANLMRAFTTFIYNRLANGQANSYSSKRAENRRNLSYFIWFKRNSDGQVVKLERERRIATAEMFTKQYQSLPSVLCSDFFAHLTRSLTGFRCSNSSSTSAFGSLASSLSSLSLAASSSASSSCGCLPADQMPAATKRQVEVFCRLQQVDKRTGRPLSRHQLSRVREEETDEEVSDIELDLGDSLSNEKIKITKSTRCVEERKDFGSFLNLRGKNCRKNKRKVKMEPEVVTCYELFCIHKTDLILHKAQVAFEAEKLVERVGRLLELRMDEDEE